MHTNEESSSTEKSIAIKLEPLLGEKLLRKREVADKLEEKQQLLRSTVYNKEESNRKIREDLKKKEESLLHSVQLIGGFIRKMQDLRKDAGNMFNELNLKHHESNLELFKLKRENENVSERTEKLEEVLKSFGYYKAQLENIVTELPQYQSVNDLVNYYLVLKILRNDLQNEKLKFQEKEKYRFEERQRMIENIKNYPLKILEKENTLYKLKDKIKEVRSLSTELKQQLDNLMSEKTAENTSWYDTQKWIEKLCRSCCDRMPLVQEVSKSSLSTTSQLEKIIDLVWMATEIVTRLTQQKLKDS